MQTVLRNLFAVILGFLIGSVINMGLITVGPLLIPPPDGVNPGDMESLAASMHLFKPQHFIFPFLAHALGTLVGALGAYFLAASQPRAISYIVGVLFLFGGIAVATMLPSPMWFVVVDLGFAYLPMAFLAVLVARRISST